MKDGRIVSKLVLGRRYLLHGRVVKIVGYYKNDILVQFDDRNIHNGYDVTTYNKSKDERWENLIKFEGSAVGFVRYAHTLEPYEFKVKATDLAKFMYPTAKEEDGFLILED
jgi:hypothetical protein